MNFFTLIASLTPLLLFNFSPETLLGSYRYNHILYSLTTPKNPAATPQVLPAQTTAPTPSHLTSGVYNPPPPAPPSATPLSTITPISPTATTPSSVLSFKSTSPTGGSSVGLSETDLWGALVAYRASHSRTPVIREEAMCNYARKRVSQHLGRTDLDNHAGFEADAASGTLFSETGDSFTQLGEVLAYLPNVQTATQVIEWGWDSSPAHREGLLSNESTHACIVGTSPFFVGILGHR